MTPDLYTRFYLWMVAHRRLVLIITFLVTVAGIGISTRIDLEEDILDILPHHDQRVDEYRYALRKFRQIDRLYIDVGIDRATGIFTRSSSTSASRPPAARAGSNSRANPTRSRGRSSSFSSSNPISRRGRRCATAISRTPCTWSNTTARMPSRP